MLITSEKNLTDFEFWGPAETTARYLTDYQLTQLETVFEDAWPNGIDETRLNDMFAYSRDFIASILGYEDFDQIMEENK